MPLFLDLLLAAFNQRKKEEKAGRDEGRRSRGQARH
jgi:hypothetical protein